MAHTNLLAHLATNVRQPLFAIEALGFEATVSEHLGDLGVFLSVLSEYEFTLVVVVLVLSTPPILSSLNKASDVRDVIASKAIWVNRTFPLFWESGSQNENCSIS